MGPLIVDYQPMKPVNFLPFLFALSAYGVEADVERGARLCVVMGSFSLHTDCHQVYQYRDKQGGMHHINVDYHIKSASACEFIVQDTNAQQKLSFLMEFGSSPESVLHTTVSYRDCVKAEEVFVSSWAPTRKKNEGCLKISAPLRVLKGRQTPIQWSTPIAHDTQCKEPSLGARPANYGIITADLHGANVTQYVFRTSNIHEGVFVNMSLVYERLSTVEFSWGTEAYGGKEVNENMANTKQSDALTVQFQRVRGAPKGQ